jgi:hypothetical protein
MRVRFELRKGQGGGTAVKVFDDGDLHISYGAWVSIEFDGFQFEADTEDFPLLNHERYGMSLLTNLGTEQVGEIKQRCMDLLREAIHRSEVPLRRLMRNISYAYKMGVEDGNQQKAAEIRHAIGIG